MKRYGRWLWIPMLILVLAVAVYRRAAAPGPSHPEDRRGARPAPAGPPPLEMDPETHARMAPQVAEYFLQRKKAVLAGDVQVLWDRYPALKEGADPTRGINAEAQAVAGYRPLKPIDGNFSLESYERLKYRVLSSAEVFVHGSETFLYRNPDGKTGESGGVILITLHFLPDREEGYTLVKTDEVTLAELHQQQGR